MFTALYVHVPFCARKCDYCAFYSVPRAGADRRRAYLCRLAAEFGAGAGECEALDSVFVGGGTPTILEAGELSDLLASVRDSFTLGGDCELTVECNPDTLTGAKAQCGDLKSGMSEYTCVHHFLDATPVCPDFPSFHAIWNLDLPAGFGIGSALHQKRASSGGVRDGRPEISGIQIHAQPHTYHSRGEYYAYFHELFEMSDP